MPHYQYENITDKGSTFSAVEKVSEGDKEYEKRTLTHELEVTLNGEVYNLSFIKGGQTIFYVQAK